MTTTSRKPIRKLGVFPCSARSLQHRREPHAGAGKYKTRDNAFLACDGHSKMPAVASKKGGGGLSVEAKVQLLSVVPNLGVVTCRQNGKA